MGNALGRIAILIALGGLAGCVTPAAPPPNAAEAAKAEGEVVAQPSSGAVYHASGGGYEGTGVVPYAGNRLGDNPYTSEQDYY